MCHPHTILSPMWLRGELQVDARGGGGSPKRNHEALRQLAGAAGPLARTVLLDCGPGEAKRAADRISLIIAKQKIQVKGGIPRAAIQASPPSRNAKLKAFFYAKDKFAIRNELGSWQVCSRGLELWDKTKSRTSGWFDADADRWTCNPTAIQESGLNHPDDDKEYGQEQAAEEAPQPPDDAAPAQHAGEREQAHERPEPEQRATKLPRTMRATSSAPPIPGTTSTTPQPQVNLTEEKLIVDDVDMPAGQEPAPQPQSS